MSLLLATVGDSRMQGEQTQIHKHKKHYEQAQSKRRRKTQSEHNGCKHRKHNTQTQIKHNETQLNKTHAKITANMRATTSKKSMFFGAPKIEIIIH